MNHRTWRNTLPLALALALAGCPKKDSNSVDDPAEAPGSSGHTLESACALLDVVGHRAELPAAATIQTLPDDAYAVGPACALPKEVRPGMLTLRFDPDLVGGYGPVVVFRYDPETLELTAIEPLEQGGSGRVQVPAEPGSTYVAGVVVPEGAACEAPAEDACPAPPAPAPDPAPEPEPPAAAPGPRVGIDVLTEGDNVWRSLPGYRNEQGDIRWMTAYLNSYGSWAEPVCGLLGCTIANNLGAEDFAYVVGKAQGKDPVETILAAGEALHDLLEDRGGVCRNYGLSMWQVLPYLGFPEVDLECGFTDHGGHVWVEVELDADGDGTKERAVIDAYNRIYFYLDDDQTAEAFWAERRAQADPPATPDEEDPPVGDDTPPAGEDDPPTGEDDPPAGEAEPPTGEEEPPAGEEEPPAGEAPPPEDGVAPVEGTGDDPFEPVGVTIETQLEVDVVSGEVGLRLLVAFWEDEALTRIECAQGVDIAGTIDDQAAPGTDARIRLDPMRWRPVRDLNGVEVCDEATLVERSLNLAPFLLAPVERNGNAELLTMYVVTQGSLLASAYAPVAGFGAAQIDEWARRIGGVGRGMLFTPERDNSLWHLTGLAAQLSTLSGLLPFFIMAGEEGSPEISDAARATYNGVALFSLGVR